MTCVPCNIVLGTMAVAFGTVYGLLEMPYVDPVSTDILPYCYQPSMRLSFYWLAAGAIPSKG